MGGQQAGTGTVLRERVEEITSVNRINSMMGSGIRLDGNKY